MRAGRFSRIAFVGLVFLGVTSPVRGQDIVDVLSRNCFTCHGPLIQRPMGGLSMKDTQSLIKGGTRGPAVVPGRPEESRLFQAVLRTGDLNMPPAGPLSEKDTELIRQWIAQGAVWPERKATAHWAYSPIVKPAIPTVRHSDWIWNPIDAFVVAAWEKRGLEPAPLADRNTRLRRVSFDLIGLPPNAKELDLFLADQSPKAYEKVVDRLLGDEQHGVNYARHWMDVLRYVDVDEHMPFSGIYRWREWLIHALNRDLPYDQFVKAQLVGDLLEDPSAIYATGFLARGAESEKDAKRLLAFGAVETAGAAFLGATVACAKCHDHMFDPIRQADYYGLKAIFDPVVPDKRILADPTQQALHQVAMAHYQQRKTELEKPLNEFLEPFREKLQADRIKDLPPVVQEAVRTPEERRTEEQKKLADDYAPILRIDPPKYREIMTPDQIRTYEGLRAPLEALTKPADLETFWSVREDEELAAKKSFVLDTGDPDRPKEEVNPMFHIGGEGFDVQRSPCAAKSFTTGGRQQFVDWMLDRKNPLPARVVVNRIWQWHFGTGLVKTPSDFGALSEPPSHPELLDWLATYFVESGYRMKALHRLIATSRTYQLSSHHVPVSASLDPDNTMLWRMPVRRLTAEETRDSILLLSGKLDLSLGGKSFTELPDYHFPGSRVVIGNLSRDRYRRGVYMVRGYNSTVEMMPSFLQIFDVDNGLVPNPVRTQSITALQALFLMNSPLVEGAVADFGERLAKEWELDFGMAIQRGFRMALSRDPTPEETGALEAYLGDAHASTRRPAERLAWFLINLDEFLFVK
ncbi:MAG: PSD1 and planctomycete cytochrome C domain-containing protein [Acidobacteriota bacterium]